MPLPRALARLNRVGLNRVMRHLAPWLPGLGVVVHHGRRSGREFRTPVNVFRHGREWTFALTYGADSDWVRNVRAADGCELLIRRRHIRLHDPRLVHDETRSAIRPLERAVLGVIDVSDFLVLSEA